MPRSWRPEVNLSQNPARPEWGSNALRFAAEEEAEASAADLYRRWMGCYGYRAAPSDDEPNYRREDGRDVRIER